MKVNALVDCKGIGYDFKKGDSGELPDKLGHKLIKFGYVQEIKEPVIEPVKEVVEKITEAKVTTRKAKGARTKR